MDNKLGEVFFSGRIVNLNEANEDEMANMLESLRDTQVLKKEAIRANLNQMREEF